MDTINAKGINQLISGYKDFAKSNQEYVENFFTSPTLFSSLEIETVNRCNGECSFCPVNRTHDTRQFSKMPDSLFRKIIDELHNLNYNHRLALYSNNEPFIDKRIEKFAEYARMSLPDACIYIYTNGTLLTLERFLRIIPHLTYMIIDNYNDDYVLHDNLIEIKRLCDNNPYYGSKVKFSMRKKNEVLFSRGGNAPNKSIDKALDMSCILPFKQMVIRPNGELSLCCNDALGHYTLGNVASDSIIDCWYSEDYHLLRRKLSEGRFNCELCCKCDALYSPSDY